jgi:ubiquinone/menaquinone biosynthesis methyltransferase
MRFSLASQALRRLVNDCMSIAVRDLFTHISPTYDRLNHLLSFNIDRRWRKKAIARLHQSADQVTDILDVCAGTYDLSILAAQKFPKAKIQALDFSQGMLDAGRPKLERAGLAERIHPVCADALHLPFADASFDVVMCAYGLRNLDDKRAGTREMKRVLRPGGELLILEFFRPKSFVAKVFNKTYAETILPCVGGWVSGDKKAYAYLRDSIRGFLSVDEYMALLAEENFAAVRSHDFIFSISSAVLAGNPS